MRKEDDFLIYCMERYRYYKNLQGKDAAKLFEKHGVYIYIKQYFESLYTMGDYYIVQDIDVYIRDRRDILRKNRLVTKREWANALS